MARPSSEGRTSRIAELVDTYRDLIPYAVFGVLTTLVNIVGYWACAHPLGIGVLPSTVIAWVAAVLFAYLTNRRWVFHSTATGRAVLVECAQFFGARLATGAIDFASMALFVELLGFDDVVVKTLANVVVIILNYVLSKFVIFKHDDEGGNR
jgi:putative flippase GtrA